MFRRWKNLTLDVCLKRELTVKYHTQVDTIHIGAVVAEHPAGEDLDTISIEAVAAAVVMMVRGPISTTSGLLAV
jgi:hypothetical protein